MIIWMTDPPASCTTRRLASLNRERPVGEDKSLVRPSCRLDRLNMCVSRVEQGQVATKLRDPGPVRAKNLLGRRDLHGSTTLISNSTTTSTTYPGSRLSLDFSAVRVLTGRFELETTSDGHDVDDDDDDNDGTWQRCHTFIYDLARPRRNNFALMLVNYDISGII